MARILQDFKLVDGDQVGEILWEIPIPDGVTVENVVHDRMADHFKTKTVQAVRVIDGETGDEIYRWTWWDENDRRMKRLNEAAKAELQRRKESSDHA